MILKLFLVADLLCGAGGTSTGAKRAIERAGRKMELVCVNHWDMAIETHKKNHPEARHYCQDIASVRPHIVVPEGYLDLLMASPTCTHHSRARGCKPTSDQQRSDPWHIITWLTELRVKSLLIENVPEFVEWGPVDARNGKPLKSRKGEYFKAWLRAISALGFRIEHRLLNAADYGDATTRTRFIMLARSDRQRLLWPMPSHSKSGSGDMFGGGAKRWRAAREIIDWDLRGRSIYDRKRPLAPSTLKRIHAGLVKFDWPESYIVVLRNHMDAQGIDLPVPAITSGGLHIGTAQPMLLPQASNHNPSRDVDDPIPTVTTVSRIGLVEPFIATVAHGASPGERDPSSRRVKDLNEPLGTVTSGGKQFAMVEPFVLSQASGGAPREVEQPVPTITGGGAGSAHALIAPYYGSGSGLTCKDTGSPLDTVTAKGRFGLVMPITHPGDTNRSRSLEDPLPTVTCAHRGELAFIAASFSERDGQAPRTHDLSQPTPTICATGRVNLVEPAVAEPFNNARQYDILFRMLEPHELAAAMGFDDQEPRYEFAGNKTQIVKQIGNAVAVNMAAALVGAILGNEIPQVYPMAAE